MIVTSRIKDRLRMTMKKMTMMATRMAPRYMAVGAALLCAASATLTSGSAQAQEIQLTGPLEPA